MRVFSVGKSNDAIVWLAKLAIKILGQHHIRLDLSDNNYHLVGVLQNDAHYIMYWKGCTNWKFFIAGTVYMLLTWKQKKEFQP